MTKKNLTMSKLELRNRIKYLCGKQNKSKASLLVSVTTIVCMLIKPKSISYSTELPIIKNWHQWRSSTYCN